MTLAPPSLSLIGPNSTLEPAPMSGPRNAYFRGSGALGQVPPRFGEGIAAPLFARDRQVVGAMSIAAVSYRVDVETLRGWWPVLQSHAEQLNAELIPFFDRYI